MMRNKSRPVYKVPLTKGDKWIEGLALTILLLTWAIVYFNYKYLPERIPADYNSSSSVDAIVHKWDIWILPMCSTLIYLFLTFIDNYPQIFNYLEEITVDNVKQQYTMGTRIIRFLKLMMLIVFATIVLATSDLGKGNKIVSYLAVASGPLFILALGISFALWRTKP